MKAESIARMLKSWENASENTSGNTSERALKAIVWDGARGHKGDAYEDVQACRIQQPPYAPELQPAERVFQHLRAQIEGVVYGTLAAKKEAVEQALRELAACPERVQSLTCWDWIEKALTKRPSQ